MYYSSGNYEAFATPKKPAKALTANPPISSVPAWRRCPRPATWCAMPR